MGLSKQELNSAKELFGEGFKDEVYEQFKKKFKKIGVSYPTRDAVKEEWLVNFVKYSVLRDCAIVDERVDEVYKWDALVERTAKSGGISPCTRIKQDENSSIANGRFDESRIIKLTEYWLRDQFNDKALEGNGGHKTIIFTNYHEKAKNIIEEITRRDGDIIENSLMTKNEGLIKYLNGDTVKWLRNTQGARGHRCSELYVDVDTPIDFIENIIIPTGLFATKDTVHVF